MKTIIQLILIYFQPLVVMAASPSVTSSTVQALIRYNSNDLNKYATNQREIA
jgi:hypothetical protein